jgi:hypothetical protein
MTKLHSPQLSLGTLAFGVALTDLEAWIALADHVDTATSTHHLAIRVTVLESSNRRYNLHFLNPTYLMFSATQLKKGSGTRKVLERFKVLYLESSGTPF